MLFENREVGDRLEHRLKQRLMREPGTHQLSRRNDCSGQTELHVSRTGPSRTFTQVRFGMSACGPKRQFLRRNHTSEVGVKPTCQDSSTDAFVESPGGISPSGAPRTVHDPLESHGSRCSAVAMTQCPMSKERWVGPA